jgi:DNA-cytosine methyltransferase
MLYLIELFAGIGSQAKALKKLGIPFTHHRVVEWDKYAIKSYNAIHNTNFETSDITKIKGEDLGITETNKYNYLMTYSFPCQDLSKAGKGKGMTKGDNTRSGLLWEVERLLRECKELPQYLLMENVPDVIGQKNIKDFAMWCEFLESIGYRNFYQLLNAKDYGIPQNRNRCFMVSILKTKNQIFQFPKPIPLKLRLKDMLEDEVDEKYYLSETAIQYMFNTNYQQNKFKTRVQGEIASTLCARDYKDPKCILVGNLFGGKWDNINESARRVYSEGGLAPTIHTCQGGNTEPKVAQKVAVAVAQRKRENGQEIETSNREYANAITTVQKDSMVLTCESLPKPFTMKDYLSGKYDWFVNKVGMLIEDCDDYDGGENLEHKVNVTDKTLCLNSKVNGKQPSVQNRIYDANAISTAITTSFMPSIAIPEATKKGYALAKEGDGIYINRPHQKRGVVQKGMIQTLKTSGGDVGVVVLGNYSPSGHNASRIVDKNGLSPTVMENHGTVTAIQQSNLKIRKLTPKECWRLMGFSDEDFDKASKVNSNSQLYKQAGNSIVVNVLMEIFKKMFIDTSIDNYQTNLFDFI